MQMKCGMIEFTRIILDFLEKDIFYVIWNTESYLIDTNRHKVHFLHMLKTIFYYTSVIN